MELLIELRQYQYLNLAGQPIVYSGTNPADLVPQIGTVPQNQWIDFTIDTANLDKFKATWTMLVNSQGQNTPGSYNPQKTTTGNMLFEAAAYQFIKAWCIDDVAAPLNAIEVRITDTSCGTYEGFAIKSNQIRWCETDICEFDVTLKQRDDAYACIQKTVIADNWQGWFQKEPANGKKHPRFSYCNEARPNGMLIMQWWSTGIVAGSTLMVMIPLLLLINSILFAINGLIMVINAIISAISALFGGSNNTQAITPIQFVDLNDIIDSYKQYYIESAGCGREHPAPLIRDYIQNVCDKCGITVDRISAPIFFSETLTIEASSGMKTNMKNPYYNACYLNANYKRGIRRFKNINYFNGPQANDTEFYIEENSPLLALDDFLDQLKGLFNAEWRIKSGTLYFWRKDWYLNGSYLYDFTYGSDDRKKILEGICFEWNEVKYPAYCEGLYSMDAADTCGNEALAQINGLVSFGNVDNNPNFEGKLEKTSTYFGGAKFRLDGAATDYIFDAMQVVVNGQILQPWTIPQMKDVDNWLGKYANYALLLKDETCTLPKILCWDGESYLNARCVMDVVPVNNNLVTIEPVPTINTKYNANTYNNGVPVYQTWYDRHPPQTDVIGGALAGGSAGPGVYSVRDYFGSIVSNNAARLVNYPMYFEPGYENTMWDLFHWIDDPRRNPGINMNWSVKIDLCCEDLKKIKCLGDASEIVLFEKVKLPTQYYNDGKITEITVSYDGSETIGKYIELKGTL